MRAHFEKGLPIAGLGLAWILVLGLCACGGGDGRGRIAFTASFEGLPRLGPDYVYAGWAVVGEEVVGTGRFRLIPSAGGPDQVELERFGTIVGTTAGALFGPSNTRLGSAFPFIQDASAWFLTIEEANGPLDERSERVLLGGSFSGTEAQLTVRGTLDANGEGFGLADFSGISGQPRLTNPTGGGNSTNGVWFDQLGNPGQPSLVLPSLPVGFAYEAAVSDGVESYALGVFTDPDRPDRDAGIAGTRGPLGLGLPVPGQDFVRPVAAFRTPLPDLASGDWSLFVTLEPEDDGSRSPFPIELLRAQIPTTAAEAGVGNIAFSLRADPGLVLPRFELVADAGGLSLSGPSLPSLGSAASHYALWVETSAGLERIAEFGIEAQTGRAVGMTTFGAVSFGSGSLLSFGPGNVESGVDFARVAQGREAFLAVVRDDAGSSGLPPRAVLLAGEMDAGRASLTLAGSSTRGSVALSDAAALEGRAVLATPTNDTPGALPDDQRGVWFALPARSLRGAALPGLTLPEPRSGWTYEAWLSERGTPGARSIGRFRRVDRPDSDSGTWRGRGPEVGFTVPGQDFVVEGTVPGIAGLLDLSAGFRVRVAVTLDPDDALGPLGLELLEGPLPNMGGIAAPNLLDQTALLPTGTLRY